MKSASDNITRGEVQNLIKKAIADDKRDSQYGVNRVPVHTHNGLDSSKISISEATVERPLFVMGRVPGTSAAASGNYGCIYVHPQGSPPATIITLEEVHGRAGNDAGTVLLQVALLSPGDASLTGGVGIVQFDLKGTADIPVYATLIHGKPPAVIRENQRLCLQTSGTLTNVADVCVTIFLQY